MAGDLVLEARLLIGPALVHLKYLLIFLTLIQRETVAVEKTELLLLRSSLFVKKLITHTA